MDYSAENRPVIINSPSSIAGDYPADKIHLIQVMWDYQLSLLYTQSDLVLYLDATGQSDGCAAPANAADMNGKIVILRREYLYFCFKSKQRKMQVL
jgi:hypothetical protein